MKLNINSAYNIGDKVLVNLVSLKENSERKVLDFTVGTIKSLIIVNKDKKPILTYGIHLDHALRNNDWDIQTNMKSWPNIEYQIVGKVEVIPVILTTV